MNIIAAYTHDAIITHVREVCKSVIGSLGKNEFEYCFDVNMKNTCVANVHYTCSIALMPSHYHLHHCFTNFRRDNVYDVLLSANVASKMAGSDLATEVASALLRLINTQYMQMNMLVNIDINVFDGLECGVLCMHENASGEDYLFLICHGRVLYVQRGSIVVLSTSSNKHSLMNQIMEDNAECSYLSLPYNVVDERIEKIVKKFD